MHTLTTATHAAALDPILGVGVLALPHPEDDLCGPDVTTLHAAGHDDILGRLLALGWEVEEEGDWPLSSGTTASGRETWGLWHPEPVVSGPTLAEHADTIATMLATL